MRRLICGRMGLRDAVPESVHHPVPDRRRARDRRTECRAGHSVSLARRAQSGGHDYQGALTGQCAPYTSAYRARVPDEGAAEPPILPRHAHRALVYVERLNAVGVTPSVNDVEALAQSDGPRGAEYLSAFGSTFATLARSLYGPKLADAEPVTDWLVRMRWISEVGRSGLSITPLGAALLAGLRKKPQDGSPPEREGAAAVVLRPSDPFVYYELTRVISETGEALLVDPWFKAEFLEWLHSATQVKRVLVAGKKPGRTPDIGLISVALHALQTNFPGTSIEVRYSTSPALHDRCIVKPNGEVLYLGTSITGVGRHLSTIIPLPSAAAEAIRSEVEGLWIDATSVEPSDLSGTSVKRRLPGQVNTQDQLGPEVA